jgi:hypothetical protein
LQAAMNHINKIVEEKIKTRQTTHWDWDYLPLNELEVLAGKHRKEVHLQTGRRTKSPPNSSNKKLMWGFFFIFLSMSILGMVIINSSL